MRKAQVPPGYDQCPYLLYHATGSNRTLTETNHRPSTPARRCQDDNPERMC